MLDHAASLSCPALARLLVRALDGAAMLADRTADLTGDGAWRAIAVELDLIGMRLRELARSTQPRDKSAWN